MIKHPKIGEKQYICWSCVSHAHLLIIQSDVERPTSNPRIRILIIYVEKIDINHEIQIIIHPAVTKDDKIMWLKFFFVKIRKSKIFIDQSSWMIYSNNSLKTNISENFESFK